jgi:hypothetical protein
VPIRGKNRPLLTSKPPARKNKRPSTAVSSDCGIGRDSVVPDGRNSFPVRA